MVVVNPTAQVIQPSSQVVCNNTYTTTVTFNTVNTGGNTTYTWTNDKPSIGLLANGTGDIAAFNAVNNGTTQVVATITVTPHFNNGNVTCDGPSKTFTITVNPSPHVTTQASNQSKFAGQDATFTVVAAGLVTGYQWQERVSPTGIWTNLSDGGKYSGTKTASLLVSNVSVSMNNYQYKVIVTGQCASPAESSVVTLSVEKRKTRVTYNNDITKQYSDKAQLNALLEFNNAANPGDPEVYVPLGNKIVDFKIGTQALVSAKTSDLGQAIAEQVIDLAPTSVGYNMSANFNGDDLYLSSSDNTKLFQVGYENAIVEYTGAEFASTGTATATSANVLLSATLTDSPDENRGDIRNAQVRFKLVPYSCSNLAPEAAIYTDWYPVKLVNSGDITVGQVTVSKNLDITNSCNAKTFDVIVEVQNYYTGSVTSSITITKSLGDYIVGGGHLNFGTGSYNTSSGTYKSDDGSRTNYGFNVKYSKTQNNLQGNVNVIIRSGGINYQVKGIVGGSNGTLNTNVISPTDKRAVLTCKVNMTNLSTLSQVPNSSSATAKLEMTDKGEPGVNDTYAITIFGNDGSLLYSSNWQNTVTVQSVIGGGNIQVNSTLVGAPTATTLKASTATATAGSQVTFTATVAKGSNTNALTGQVTFKDGSTILYTQSVGATGIVTFATSSLAVGNHNVTATYSGDAIFNPSASATVGVSITTNSNSMLTRVQVQAPVMEPVSFNLKAYPNPSTSQFTVSVQSSNREEKIQVRVMDLNGRVVELFNNLSANQTLQIGGSYRPGMYIVEMIQGNERKQLKLIKQPN